MKRLYLSICGDSAVGKSTLIKKLLENESGLRERFGIDHGTVEAFGYCFLGEVQERNRTWARDIHHSVADCVLHQWQSKHHHVVAELREQNPTCEHRIVLLWRPWEQHWRDYAVKHQQNVRKHGHSIATLVKNWRAKIRQKFGESSEIQKKYGIPVELVNGSTSDYERLAENYLPEEPAEIS